MIDLAKIPPPPPKPDPLECCGSGCVPCIFDYYEIKLCEWEKNHSCTVDEYRVALSSVKTSLE